MLKIKLETLFIGFFFKVIKALVRLIFDFNSYCYLRSSLVQYKREFKILILRTFAFLTLFNGFLFKVIEALVRLIFDFNAYCYLRIVHWYNIKENSKYLYYVRLHS